MITQFAALGNERALGDSAFRARHRKPGIQRFTDQLLMVRVSRKSSG